MQKIMSKVKVNFWVTGKIVDDYDLDKQIVKDFCNWYDSYINYIDIVDSHPLDKILSFIEVSGIMTLDLEFITRLSSKCIFNKSCFLFNVETPFNDFIIGIMDDWYSVDFIEWWDSERASIHLNHSSDSFMLKEKQ